MVAKRSRGDRASTGYLPTLDGWRAVAILWVLNGHQQLYHWGRVTNAYFLRTADHGVQLFFALSGFLICSRLLSEEARFGSISLRSFYVRRLFRIQPPALLFLAAVLVASVTGLVHKYWAGLLGAALMVRNLWPMGNPPSNWLTAHFWSLSVEEHFYLLLPGFLVLCRRLRLVLLGALVPLLELWRIVVLQHPALQGFSLLIYFRTDIVLSSILLGSVCALALKRHKVLNCAQRYLRPFVALFFAGTVLIEQEIHHSRFDHAVLITIYPLLLIATVLHPASWTGRVLEWAPLRFIGRISFSLYLWQQPFFNPYFVPGAGTLRSHVLLCWLCVFACAITSYYWVETPFISMGHRLAKRYHGTASENLAT